MFKLFAACLFTILVTLPCQVLAQTFPEQANPGFQNSGSNPLWQRNSSMLMGPITEKDVTRFNEPVIRYGDHSNYSKFDELKTMPAPVKKP